MIPVRPDRTTQPDAEIHSQLRALLPLYDENHPLPKEFSLDVPYREQEKPHYSGAACIQMLCAFHDRDVPPQDGIMTGLGAQNYKDLKHETFEVLLSDYLARAAQLLPAHYSPAIHIAPKMGDGLAATDFIRGQPQTRYIVNHDFYVFRRLLVARRAPIVVRLHFTTDMYPMKDEIAQYLDVTGHAVVIVGYNDVGFLVHDPWSNSRLGGTRGGSSRLITFNEIRDYHPLVNCSLDDAEMADRLGVYFEHLPMAVYPGRTIAGRLALYWPGIEGVAATRWMIDEVQVEFESTSSISFAESTRQQSGFALRPGQVRYVPFSINTGDRLGSFQVTAKVVARLTSPTFLWVAKHLAVDTKVEAKAVYRVSVQDRAWFQQYAMN